METTFIPQAVRRTRKRMEREHQTFKCSVMKDEIETVPCMYSKLLGRNENICEVILQIMNFKNWKHLRVLEH